MRIRTLGRFAVGLLLMTTVAAACGSNTATTSGATESPLVPATTPSLSASPSPSMMSPEEAVCTALAQLQTAVQQVQPTGVQQGETDLAKSLIQLNNMIQAAAIQMGSSGNQTAQTALLAVGLQISTLNGAMAQGGPVVTKALNKLNRLATKAMAAMTTCTGGSASPTPSASTIPSISVSPSPSA
jgi:hypothetical protein